MSEQPEVKWFADRLPAWSLGQLSEEDGVKFSSLLRISPPCRDLFDAFQSAGPEHSDTLEHLPSSWIARWPLMSRVLTGLERELARGHLDACEECRDDLRLAGYEPTLPRLPGQELDVETRDAVLGPAVSSDRAERPHASPSWFERFRVAISTHPQALLGGWAAIATATLLLVLIGRGDVPVRFETASLADVGLSFRGEIQTQVVSVSADDRTVVLSVEPLEGLAADATVQLELRDPDGSVIARFRGALAAMTYPRLLVIHSRRALQEGDYRLRFRPEGLEGASELVLPIRRAETP